MSRSAAAALETLALDLVESMLGHLPASPFFVKDSSLRYVAANAAMLRLCGVRRREDLIGKSAAVFFPEPAQQRYEKLDREVIRTKRPIGECLDLLLSRGEGPVWLLFRRWPVISEAGGVLGVAAIARKLGAPDRRDPTYRRVAGALTAIQQRFQQRLRLGDLAQQSGVSASQFERDFVGLLGLTPRQFLTKTRIDAAMTRLAGDASVVQVAQACGYADQSAFTRRFVASVGLTPSQYRRSLTD